MVYNKRAPQQDTEEENPGDTTFTQLDATSIAFGPSTTTSFEGDTVELVTTTATLEEDAAPTTTTQPVPDADITPTTTESLSSGLFTVLTQMTLAPSSSSLPIVSSPSVSGTFIASSRPNSASSSTVRPTVMAPASASSVNSVPNGLLMFTFMVILFMRFFNHQ